MRRLFIGFIFALAACGPSAVVDMNDGGADAGKIPDAGKVPDAGAPPDASVPDAGDSGDSGLPPDAGPTPDAGDAGEGPDAGTFDGGPVSPALPCTDTIASVYVAQTGLPAFTPSARGDIVRCAHDYTLDAGGTQAQLAGKNITMTATSGTDVFRIAYRTERRDGGEGIGTAKLFLPSNPLSAQLPVIVAAHGSDGMADSCAPSMGLTDSAELTMPFAALGYAVIAPDYAGLGNEGVQSYLDARDTAYSTLDSARALRKLLPDGTLSSKIAIVGHSQGGGAALAAQTLVKDYGADGDLVAVAVFAAEYETRLNSFGYVTALRAATATSPANWTIGLGVAKPPVYVMRQYAIEVNQLGSTTGQEGFPAAKAASLVNAITTQCLVLLGGTVQGISPLVGDLTDDTLRTGFLSCVDGTGCSGTGKALYDYLSGNILTADPAGAPVLYVQGSLDMIMLPNEEAACNVAKLTADGVTPTVCVDSGGDHSTVCTRNAAYAVGWVAAQLNGVAPPACASSTALPACTP